jgi:hypothetical protein
MVRGSGAAHLEGEDIPAAPFGALPNLTTSSAANCSGVGAERPYSRWPSLSSRRARPPETMTATQLTDFGTDQSPMTTVHCAKMRTKWKRHQSEDRASHQRKCFRVHERSCQIWGTMSSLGSFGLVRHRAQPTNVGMTVGCNRENANHSIITMGLGGHSLRQRPETKRVLRSGTSASLTLSC